jgi:hypothetical protein
MAGCSRRAPSTFLRLPFQRHHAQIVIARPHAAFVGSIESGRSVFLIGACRHDPLHHGDEALLVSLTEVGHRLTVCGASRRFHAAEQYCSGSCQPANLRPAIPVVDRALDKVTGLQSLKCACRRCPIERDIISQSRLVGGSALRQGREKAILQRRNLKGSAALLEQRDVNLVQPPDQKSRPLAERPGITGLSHWLRGHLQSLCPCPCCMNLMQSMARMLLYENTMKIRSMLRN